MKNIKLFEGYIDNKIKALRKLKIITSFIDKYELRFFLIADEYKGLYQFEYIEKNEEGDYIIDYTDYTQGEWVTSFRGQKIQKKDIKCELTELSIKVIDALIASCDNSTGNGSRLEIEFHLEMGQEPDDFIRMIKKHKEPIKFNGWMLGMFIENDHQKEVNTYKFQNTLFTFHPEAFKPFMETVDEQIHDELQLKLNLRIKNKFKDLWEEWNLEKQTKKYNL